MITLDLLLDRLPEVLVGEEAGKRLRMIGDHLPDALTGRVGLEARLHDDPRVDLLLLASALRHLEVLAGEDPTVRLGADLAALPAWQDAARLARRSLRLLRTGSPLPPAIWLEFDAGPSGAPPVPGLFTAAAPDPGVPQAARWDVPATVADVLGTAGDPALVPGLFATVGRVALSGLAVRQVGFFPGRTGSGVRLFGDLGAGDDAADRLLAALSRAGWAGPAGALGDWTRLCARFADRLHVGVDVTPAGILPGVGVEVSLADAAQPADDPRWAGLLDELVARGLCTPAKRDAVCALGRGYEARVLSLRRYRQGVHHVKVSVAGDGQAAAKAYFGAYEVPS